MKKERGESKDNSFGVASVILGILGIMFSSIPLQGIVFGVIALVFAGKQRKKNQNKWSRNGKTLAIIGIILSIIFTVLLFWLSQHPEFQSQLFIQNGNA